MALDRLIFPENNIHTTTRPAQPPASSCGCPPRLMENLLLASTGLAPASTEQQHFGNRKLCTKTRLPYGVSSPPMQAHFQRAVLLPGQNRDKERAVPLSHPWSLGSVQAFIPC